MVFPINGPQGPKATDKAKAKTRTGGVGGPSFADVLSAAENAQETEGALPAAGLSAGLAVPSYIPDATDDLPQDTKGQTAALLKTLRDLAEAAMGGSATVARTRLQTLAESVGTDAATLTPAQQKAVAEVRTRAAVEAAKIEK